jgi:hypothetical protein
VAGGLNQVSTTPKLLLLDSAFLDSLSFERFRILSLLAYNSIISQPTAFIHLVPLRRPDMSPACRLPAVSFTQRAETC